MTTAHRPLDEINTEIYGILFLCSPIHKLCPAFPGGPVAISWELTINWWFCNYRKTYTTPIFNTIRITYIFFSLSMCWKYLVPLEWYLLGSPRRNSYQSLIVWMSPGCALTQCRTPRKASGLKCLLAHRSVSASILWWSESKNRQRY